MLCNLLDGSDMQIKNQLTLYSEPGLKSLPNTCGFNSLFTGLIVMDSSTEPWQGVLGGF